MCRDSLQIPTDQAASILVSLITNTAIFGPETFQTFFFFFLNKVSHRILLDARAAGKSAGQQHAF